jgi:CO/xanthine dehydrogenase Mo-binding subunit
MPGVVGVVHDGNFAGLAAERREQAEAAIAAVQATWQEINSPYTSDNIFDAIKSTADAGAPIGNQTGDVDGALTGAAQTVKVRVTAPYVAHAPMEPMTALVSIQPDKTEVWTSTQIPFEAQDAVASTLGIPRDQVILYPVMSGGAYGRKDIKDVVIEAAKLAKGVGRPVRLNWNRQEEFRFEYARPAMVNEVTAALDANGQLVAWDWATYAAAYPEPGSGIGYDAAYFPGGGYGAAAYPGSSKPMSSGANSAAAVLDHYQIPNVRSTLYQGVSPIGVTFWRCNGSPVNGLARDAAIDQLAELAGMDPVSFRDGLLQNNPRLAAVMHAAVDKSGWKPGVGSTGQGFGLGLTNYDSTYVAAVAKVSVDATTGKVTAQKVWAAVDAGLLVNPMGARHQIEGSIVSQGTSSTLNEQLVFANGRVSNDTFERYAPIGFLDAPAVDVTFIEDKTQPMGGIGEPAVGTVSAAISNAIYDAVGVRMLDLPFLPDKVLASLKAKGQ